VANQWEYLKTRYKYSREVEKYRPLRESTKLKEMFIVRYCDDFKILCKDYKTAYKISKAVESWLSERLNLEINRDKSKVINLRKNYSEFLGFKQKVRTKGKKQIAKTHISEKSKENIKNKIRKAIKIMSSKATATNVSYYNAVILGIHNYYKIANQLYKDFRQLAYGLNKSLYNKTNRIRGKRGEKSKAYQKIYGHSKRKVIYIAKIAIFPMAVVKYKMALNFQPEICNYTVEGREKIHNNLKGISSNTIRFLLENPVKSETTEYNDNRISLYIGQDGRDYVTKSSLIIGKMEVHHRKPRSKGGDDSYKNLILLSDDIHKLIHATNPETIERYLTQVRLDHKGLKKLNTLRNEIGNYILENR